jgi:hypothetical protein
MQYFCLLDMVQNYYGIMMKFVIVQTMQVLPGLDQGILGGGGVPPMLVGNILHQVFDILYLH